jgi:hypothetical protein
MLFSPGDSGGATAGRTERKGHDVIQTEGDTFVRLITADAVLLLPALLQRGASLRLTGSSRVDVRGMGAWEVAGIAALCNARVLDLETIRSEA